MLNKILLTVPALFCAILWPLNAAVAQDSRELPADQGQIQLSFSPLVKKITPSVVNIYTKRTVNAPVANPLMNDPFFAPFFGGGIPGGRMRKQVENSLGSGVIIDPQGLVVTNAHVVRAAEEITVVLMDGREFEASISLVDKASDLALLRLKDAQQANLPAASLRPSETLEVGDLVLAIGNPFGVGQTVTSGIVSALARSSLNISDFNFFIQTDAAINPGNSGGPLVAMDGGVVGINSAIYSKDGGSLGIGFAIPSEMVASVIAAEKAGQSGDKGITRPWLGVSAQTLTGDIARSLGMDRPHGALIAALHEESPLKKAGAMVGDVVTTFNGRELRDAAEMKFRMATVPLGQSARVEVMRKGEKVPLDVLAMAPPDVPARQATKIAGQNPLNGAVLGLLNPAVAVELGLNVSEDTQGVVVLGVQEGSVAARLVNPGEMILKIGAQEIKSPAQAQQMLAQYKGGPFALTIDNAGRVRQIVIR